MKRLIHRNRVPYGGSFSINRTDVGMRGKGTTFDMLDTNVRAYRKANGIPIGLSFSEELEKVVCEEYPDECREIAPEAIGDPHRLKLGDVLLGTKVAMNIMKEQIKAKLFGSASPIVAPQEAARRAQICENCDYNVPFSKPCGGGCGELRTIVKALVGSASVPNANKLGACFLCKCFLESAVWVRAELQIDPMDEALKAKFELVPNCWKKASLLAKKS